MRKYSSAYIPTFADIPPGGERRTATFLVPCNYFGDVRKKDRFAVGIFEKKIVAPLHFAPIGLFMRPSMIASDTPVTLNRNNWYGTIGILQAILCEVRQSRPSFSSSCNTLSPSLVRHFHRPAIRLLSVSSAIFIVLQHAFSQYRPSFSLSFSTPSPSLVRHFLVLQTAFSQSRPPFSPSCDSLSLSLASTMLPLWKGEKRFGFFTWESKTWLYCFSWIRNASQV